jgi:hypothetical protein
MRQLAPLEFDARRSAAWIGLVSLGSSVLDLVIVRYGVQDLFAFAVSLIHKNGGFSPTSDKILTKFLTASRPSL